MVTERKVLRGGTSEDSHIRVLVSSHSVYLIFGYTDLFIGNHFPTNPAPSQLTMPDLSQPPSAMGIGETADSVPMYLAVLEEWSPCEVRSQHRIMHTLLTFSALRQLLGIVSAWLQTLLFITQRTL